MEKELVPSKRVKSRKSHTKYKPQTARIIKTLQSQIIILDLKSSSEQIFSEN